LYLNLTPDTQGNLPSIFGTLLTPFSRSFKIYAPVPSKVTHGLTQGISYFKCFRLITPKGIISSILNDPALKIVISEREA